MKLSKKALSLKRAMVVAFAEKQSMTIDKAIKIAKTEVKDPYAQHICKQFQMQLNNSVMKVLQLKSLMLLPTLQHGVEKMLVK